MTDLPILRITTKILMPPILLFGLYVQFHGDFGPGGGFQAGVIFAAGVILHALVFGLAPARAVFPPRLVATLIALGVLIFAGTGVVSVLLGGAYLDYNVFSPAHPPHGQHIGILVVEAGVGITVAGAMLGLFFTFAAQPPADDGEGKEATAKKDGAHDA